MNPEDKAQQEIDKMFIDLISIDKDDLSMSFGKIVDEIFSKWLEIQSSSRQKFSLEQNERSVLIKEHIISYFLTPLEDNVYYTTFNQESEQMKLFKIFGGDYEKILSELHEVLIRQ